MTQNLAFEFLNCGIIIKTDLSGNTVDFQKLAKLTIFGIFNEILATQNVNVARFARNVE